MLKRVKKSVLRVAKRIGGFDLLSNSTWRRDRLLVLGYHGISLKDEHLWDPSLFMPPDMFRSRIEAMLEFGCNILPLPEAIKLQKAGKLPEKAVTITFDDGFYNFYHSAQPILEEYGLPGSVYVTTYYSLYNLPVFGISVDYLIWRARDKNVEVKIDNCVNGSFDLSDPSIRSELHEKIFDYSLYETLSATCKTEVLERLCDQLGISFADFCSERLFNLMTPEEIREVSGKGVDVELHTHRHRMPRDRELFDREIRDNREVVADHTGKVPSHFCYPSGNYDPIFFDWIKENGLLSATTCDTGMMSRTTNPMQVPRLIDTASLSEIEFEGWLTGAASLLPRRRLIRKFPAPALLKVVSIDQLELLGSAVS